MEIKPLTLKRIRDCGKDEYWLQELICANPNVLGLGDLEVVAKEKSQRSGGRLDILLRNTDEEFFEVEVMLGDTDESHIIRTIEYWDLEKRRWPKKQHTAVLVAERINSRFYNVIHLLSQGVPIIGIQANIYELGTEHGVVFSKIVDSYEEPEVATEVVEGYYTRDSLKRDYPATEQIVDNLVHVLEQSGVNPEVTYRKYGATLFVDGRRRLLVQKRGGNESSLEYVVPSEHLDAMTQLLNERHLPFDHKYGRVRMWVGVNEIGKQLDLHCQIFQLLSQ